MRPRRCAWKSAPSSRNAASFRTEDRFASWNTFSPEFSKAAGQEGLDRHHLAQAVWRQREELPRPLCRHRGIVGGNSAPAGAHWVADRQSGPLLLRFGSEEQRQAILPRITAGECYFSNRHERGPTPVRTSPRCAPRAEPVPGGFRVNGTKVWTSGAHRNNYCIALVRTVGPARRSPQGSEPDPGRSQDSGHNNPGPSSTSPDATTGTR